MILVTVAPVPIVPFLVVATLVEVSVISVGVMFPLVVVNDLAIPPVIIVIIRIVDARMHRAAGGEYGERAHSREQNRSDLPEQLAHRSLPRCYEQNSMQPAEKGCGLSQ